MLADVLSLVVYVICLYVEQLTWVATGLHMALQYGTQRVTQRVVVLSVLQIARCSDHLRVSSHATSMAMSALGFVLAVFARAKLFAALNKYTIGMVMLCFYTLIVAVRVDVSNEFRVARAVLYIGLHHALPSSFSAWERAACCTWVLGGYHVSWLCAAVVQMVVDTNMAYARRRHNAEKMETWDLQSAV